MDERGQLHTIPECESVGVEHGIAGDADRVVEGAHGTVLHAATFDSHVGMIDDGAAVLLHQTADVLTG